MDCREEEARDFCRHFDLSEMKLIAAYLLALLGGNSSPTAEDLKSVLGSGMFLNSSSSSSPSSVNYVLSIISLAIFE